jgi:hypothetical protein
MTTIDRIRQLASLGFVVAMGLYLHVGVGARLARAQTTVPNYVQFGPNHQTEEPGFGLPISPIAPNYGIDPVLPGPASPHSRTSTTFFPMVKDSRLTFDSALAADSVAIGGSGYGGSGFGGFGYGGFGYPGMGGAGIGAPGLYGSYGWPGSGVGTPLSPMPGFGRGTYLAGNPLPNSTAGMGMGGGNPADPAAGQAGSISLGAVSEDAFDNAANGRPSPTRPVRSNRATAARRPAVRKPAPQPSKKFEAEVSDAVPSRPETPRARPQQANKPQEGPGAVKSAGTDPPRRRSMLGPPQ